jgi:hypothetical protein
MSINYPTLSAAADLAHFRHHRHFSHFICFSSLFTHFPSTTVENVRQITPFYAKQTQFQKRQNEYNLRHNKQLQDFVPLSWAKKQTQFKANKAKNKANSNPIKAKTNPKQTQSFQRPKMNAFSWIGTLRLF